MKPLAALAILIALASCGADGAPRPPAPEPATGLSVSGQVKVGISG
ncbi:argininosuccinate lyase [Albidovulum sp.]|nr:argininosuccinate lyase [Paracoccaceae bacterium]MCC0045819.1 argininosuccinate lyase [Defluviimonas sp.]HPE24703.1 argininosuccinate lyase [Albidovulum sp.]MCB2118916.1 argininosuccinate lyase [Paracoccaceae bacterium]MCB2123820.1 argininosuccinate lyase [Paracoccaceae bacterium]